MVDIKRPNVEYALSSMGVLRRFKWEGECSIIKELKGCWPTIIVVNRWPTTCSHRNYLLYTLLNVFLMYDNWLLLHIYLLYIYIKSNIYTWQVWGAHFIIYPHLYTYQYVELYDVSSFNRQNSVRYIYTNAQEHKKTF